MRVLLLLVSTVFSIAITGSSRPPAQRPVAQELPVALASKWAAAIKLAYERYQSGDYARVAQVLENFRPFVAQYSPHPKGVRTLQYLGNAEFRRFHYRQAMTDYLAAREQARQLGLAEVAVLSYNLSTLYYQMGETAHSAREAEVAESEFASQKLVQFLPNILLHRARLESRLQKWDTAEKLYKRAIEGFASQGEAILEATAREILGDEYIQRKQLSAAEQQLTEALQKRKKVKGASLTFNLQELGLLRLAQGNPSSALELVNAAVRGSADGSDRMPAYQTYYTRARILAEMGRWNEALTELRLAIRQIEDMRADQAPADALRISSRLRAQDAYSLFVATASKLYQAHPSPELAAEALAAADKGRSLQESRNDIRQTSLPDEYGKVLEELRSAYGSLYRGKTPAALQRVDQLRLRLSEMEAAAGIISPGIHTRAKLELGPLAADQALLVFHLGEEQSTLWSATNRSLRMYKLPAKAVIEAKALHFAKTIAKGERARDSRFYQLLFSQLPSEVLNKERWMLVTDGELASVPFSALETGSGYLVEHRSIQLLPGIWALGQSEESWKGVPLAVADPVYNLADPRSPVRRQRSWFASGSGEDTSAPPLARLPGTQREVDACSRIWGPSRIVNGAQATLAGLERGLHDQPSIIHIATHVVPSPENPREAFIMLGIGADGIPQLAGSEWIASHRVRPALVMMTGCGSGEGSVLPGEGLMGLTRAWQRAGARMVAATHWPVHDDGHFAQAFYRNYSAKGAASAMRLAQLEMIHSQSYRSRPDYWAGYFLSGRD